MSDTLHIEIPLDDLHDSPSNPRTTYSESYLQELATNLRAVGRILQPLLVRPRVPPLFGNDPDAQIGYEIVFGHCRRRAAELAGFATAPCMVRQMSDLEVKVAQVSENLQRKDVHPIEEAQGYQVLIDEHNETADRLAEQFGKSRSYVYGRLKLLAACPEVRKACLAGEVGAEVALLLSRLRTPKLQEKALGYIKGRYIDLKDGGKSSFRAARDLLIERFTLDLNKAPFPTDEEMLLPAAGNCVTCPKRTANAPEFEDVVKEAKPSRSGNNAGADVCTDPDCFQAKKIAFFKRKAADLVAKGKIVVDGNRARNAVDAQGNVKGAYVSFDQVKDQIRAIPRCTIEKVVIQDPRTGKTFEAVKREDLKGGGFNVPEPKKAGARYDYEAENRKRAEESAKRDVKAKAESAVRWAILERVRAAAAVAERSAFDLRLIAYVVYQGVHWGDKEALARLYEAKNAEALEKRIGQFDLRTLTQFVLDCALVEDVLIQGHKLGSTPSALIEAAQHYGIDVGQVRTEISGATPTPSAAARAPKRATANAGRWKYRDPMTGSTWSGRGLKPKWLLVALAAGKTLADFEVATPSAAAQARKGAPAAAAGVKEVSVDADSAGDHVGQAQLELDAQAGREDDQTDKADSAGDHVGQVDAVEEVV